MKIKVVCHSNQPEHEGFLRFKKSMEYFNYDYIALNDPDYNWAKTFDVYLKYAKSIANDYTHILTTDCWDVLAFAPIQEVWEKYNPDYGLFSAEKHSFPNPSLAEHYFPTKYDWKYINCGGSLFPIPLFINFFENYDGKLNIQEWTAKEYLHTSKGQKVMLDTGCKIFQPTGHKGEDDFSLIDGRLVNNKTGSKPVFSHENGRGDMTWMNEYWDKYYL